MTLEELVIEAKEALKEEQKIHPRILFIDVGGGIEIKGENFACCCTAYPDGGVIISMRRDK